MAQYTYTKVEETIKKINYATWLTNLTASADTKIIFYQELPTVNDEEEIRIKVLIEVTS